MPRTATLSEFFGLDLRRLSAMSDARTQLLARNVSITQGKELRTRPGSRSVAQLHPNTVGLFSANGLLHTVAPSGWPSVAATQGALVRYAFVGDGDGWPLESLRKFHAVELIGTSDIGRGFPYVVVSRQQSDGSDRVEHHYIDVEPSDVSDIVDTFVATPFEPAPALVKLASRLWAPSNLSGFVHFSSIVNGPRDWLAVDDAGFLNVIDHVPGDRDIRGLTHFGDKLLVAFRDSFEVWAVDEQPSNISLLDVLNGPGTNFERTLQNVQGDLLYFSSGAFRRLATTTVTGVTRESDIGSSVVALTQDLPVDPEPVSLWSQTRGQLLTCFGSTIVALTYSPALKLVGWTTWELPFTVTDIVEANGVLYARDTEHVVHEFQDEWDSDDNVPIAFDVQTQFLDLGAPSINKQFIDLAVVQDGTCRVSAYPVPEAPEHEVQAGQAVGITRPWGRIPLLQSSSAMALRFRGTGPWRLSGIAITYTPLGV